MESLAGRSPGSSILAIFCGGNRNGPPDLAGRNSIVGGKIVPATVSSVGKLTSDNRSFTCVVPSLTR